MSRIKLRWATVFGVCFFVVVSLGLWAASWLRFPTGDVRALNRAWQQEVAAQVAVTDKPEASAMQGIGLLDLEPSGRLQRGRAALRKVEETFGEVASDADNPALTYLAALTRQVRCHGEVPLRDRRPHLRWMRAHVFGPLGMDGLVALRGVFLALPGSLSADDPALCAPKVSARELLWWLTLATLIEFNDRDRVPSVVAHHARYFLHHGPLEHSLASLTYLNNVALLPAQSSPESANDMPQISVPRGLTRLLESAALCFERKAMAAVQGADGQGAFTPHPIQKAFGWWINPREREQAVFRDTSLRWLRVARQALRHGHALSAEAWTPRSFLSSTWVDRFDSNDYAAMARRWMQLHQRYRRALRQRKRCKSNTPVDGSASATLPPQADPTGKPKTLSQKALSRSIAQDIRCDQAHTRCVMQKRLWHALSGGAREMTTSVRFVPVVRHEEVYGLRITRLKPGPNFVRELGFQIGDVLTHVDHFALASPDECLEAYNSMSKRDRAVVRYEREGQPRELKVVVK